MPALATAADDTSRDTPLGDAVPRLRQDFCEHLIVAITNKAKLQVDELEHGTPAQSDPDDLAGQLLMRMQLIRETEETLLTLFSEGRLSGTTHTSIGQEAIAVALGAHVRPGDVVFSTHRGHGH